MDELICTCKCFSFYIEGLFDDKVLFQRDEDVHRWTAKHRADDGERLVEMHLEANSTTNVFNLFYQANRGTTEKLARSLPTNAVCPEKVDLFIFNKGGFGKVICVDSVDVELNIL